MKCSNNNKDEDISLSDNSSSQRFGQKLCFTFGLGCSPYALHSYLVMLLSDHFCRLGSISVKKKNRIHKSSFRCLGFIVILKIAFKKKTIVGQVYSCSGAKRKRFFFFGMDAKLCQKLFYLKNCLHTEIYSEL